MRQFNLNWREKCEALNEEYRMISHRLNELWHQGRITTDTLDCIVDGMKQVLNKIAKKYPNVVKEGEKAMGGEILDYPAKIARREGREEGIKEGVLGFINEKIDDGLADSAIIEKLKKYYRLDDKQAMQYLQECRG